MQFWNDSCFVTRAELDLATLGQVFETVQVWSAYIWSELDYPKCLRCWNTDQTYSWWRLSNFWYLYWAFWKIHLLTIATSETSSEPSVLLFQSFFKQLWTSDMVNFCDLGSFFTAVRHRGRGKPPAGTSTGGWNAKGEDRTAEPAGRREEVKQEWMGVGELKSWGRWSLYPRTSVVGSKERKKWLGGSSLDLFPYFKYAVLLCLGHCSLPAWRKRRCCFKWQVQNKVAVVAHLAWPLIRDGRPVRWLLPFADRLLLITNKQGNISR